MQINNSSYYELVKKYKTVMIFGTNFRGLCENEKLLEVIGRKADFFLVSNKKYYKDTFDKIPVKVFSDVSLEDKSSGLVLMARDIAKDEESIRLLADAGFMNIQNGVNQSIEFDSNNSQHFKLLKEAFGENLKINLETGYCNKANILIYAVTSHLNKHQVKDTWNSKYIKYIQAGAALTNKRICDITDNSGINISFKNPYYCETTAGYWIAHNDKVHDYVGLYHYGRGFDLDDEQLCAIAENDIDVVLSFPFITTWDLCSVSYSGDKIIAPIKKVCPDYLDAVKMYLDGHLFIIANMLIAKREIFQDFYNWLYSVQLEMESMYEGIIHTRGIAYDSESLLNIFFLKNRDKYKFYFVKLKSFIEFRAE